MAVFSRTTNLLEYKKNDVSDPRLSTMVAIAWTLDVNINQNVSCRETLMSCLQLCLYKIQYTNRSSNYM